MAFSTSNLTKESIGSLHMIVGDWAGSEGDSAGTVSLKGGRVWFAQFTNQDSDAGDAKPTPYSVALSGDDLTVTVYNHQTVTNGRFVIAYR